MAAQSIAFKNVGTAEKEGSSLLPQSVSPIQVVEQTSRQIKLKFTSPQPSINRHEYGRSAEISMSGAITTSEAGYPALPYFSTWVALPGRGDYTVDVKSSPSISLGNITPVISDINGENVQPGLSYGNWQQNESYCTSGSASCSTQENVVHYPAEICRFGQPQIIRDFRVIKLNLFPISYTGITNELLLTQEITVTIHLNDNPGANEIPEMTTYSPAFTALYQSMICNFSQSQRMRNPTGNERILIIYGDYDNAQYTAKLAEFATWKKQKGYDVAMVSTAVTGYSNTEIKNYIRTQYENIYTRPDFIILIGDTTGNFPIPAWTESVSGANGSGDYTYTQLSGNDLLGDAFIGRISAEYLTQLDVILQKVYTYEKYINLAGSNPMWLNRMLLIGDTYSGISTVYVNHYIRELSQLYNPDYTYIENYTAGFVATMNQGFNQGVGFFNYRGYLGLSGWTPGAQLVNGAKLPHATILTCGTGLYDNNTATTETLIRLGTAASPAGSVTAIGLATSSTNTLFNNALTTGIYTGIFSNHMRTMGEALLNSRLYIRQIYNGSQDDNAIWFAHWTNLMGDPTMEVFVGIPDQFHLFTPPSIPVGANSIDITVTNDEGNPVEDAIVTAYSTTTQNVLGRSHSNLDGTATLYFNSPAGSGELIITVSKHDYKPLQQTVSIDNAGSLVYQNKLLYDNGTGSSVGNGDGYIGAGETIALKVELRNTTAHSITGINGSLIASSPYVTLLATNCSFPDLMAGASAVSEGYYRFRILPGLPGGQNAIRFAIQAVAADNSVYNIVFNMIAYNASLTVQSYSVISANDAVPDPGEVCALGVTVQNISIVAINNVQAALATSNDLVQIRDSLSLVGTVSAGGSATTMDDFEIWVRPQTIIGMQIPLTIRLFNDTGFSQLLNFNLEIGTVNSTTPTGPDSYGYVIYDDTDVANAEAPAYDWIELNPLFGGQGTLIDGFYDIGHPADEGDQVGSDVLETIDLPFPFSFYGISYDQITVCVNGFIVFGETQCGEFRNYPLPGGYGPPKMLAAFWDDLIIIDDGGIYQYFDSVNHCFIIEYYKLRNGYNRIDIETFEVILYDPAFYHTSRGDGMVKVQYQEFNNIDIGGNGDDAPEHGNYCTIGLKDHTNSVGLQYSYNNQYSSASSILGDQRAILFTTVPVIYEQANLVFEELSLNDSNANHIAEPGETLNLGLELKNIGLLTATGVSVTGTLDSDMASFGNDHSLYHDIATNSTETNISALSVIIDPLATDNAVISLTFTVTANSGTWHFFYPIMVKKPQLYLNSYFINDLDGNANTIPEPGESCVLIVNMGNDGLVPSIDTHVNLVCSYPHITIDSPTVEVDQIKASSVRQLKYPIHILPSAINGDDLDFTLSYESDQIALQDTTFVITLSATGMSAGFENDNGSFIPTPLNGGWEWGISSSAGSHYGTRVWATRLNQHYSPNANWILDTPQGGFAVSEGAVLNLWHSYNTQTNVDGGNLKLTTDDGASWIILNPEGGYPSVPSAMGEPGFSGNSNGSILSRFDLSVWTNQYIRLRFQFKSDGVIENPGWFIDDVSTTGFVNFGGKVFGTISSSHAALDISNVDVSNNLSWYTNPDATGDYALYFPFSTSQLIASALGYATPVVQTVSISPVNLTAECDFLLLHYAPVTNLHYALGEQSLTIAWNTPQQTDFPIINYSVYRKIDTGSYALCDTTTSEFYTQPWDEPGTHYGFYVLVNYEGGSSIASDTLFIELPAGIWDDVTNADLSRLYSSFPNPFFTTTRIIYGVETKGSETTAVTIRIYNIKGQLVKTLVNQPQKGGTYTLDWDGTDTRGSAAASGIYFCKMDCGRYSGTRKLMLLK
jgi:uncharacterized repeat protein (TIGR01451 family)